MADFVAENKKEVVSKVSINLDTEPVEVCIWLVIRCRFDKLNDQLAVLRQPLNLFVGLPDGRPGYGWIYFPGF